MAMGRAVNRQMGDGELGTKGGGGGRGGRDQGLALGAVERAPSSVAARLRQGGQGASPGAIRGGTGSGGGPELPYRANRVSLRANPSAWDSPSLCAQTALKLVSVTHDSWPDSSIPSETWRAHAISSLLFRRGCTLPVLLLLGGACSRRHPDPWFMCGVLPVRPSSFHCYLPTCPGSRSSRTSQSESGIRSYGVLDRLRKGGGGGGGGVGEILCIDQ